MHKLYRPRWLHGYSTIHCFETAIPSHSDSATIDCLLCQTLYQIIVESIRFRLGFSVELQCPPRQSSQIWQCYNCLRNQYVTLCSLEITKIEYDVDCWVHLSTSCIHELNSEVRTFLCYLYFLRIEKGLSLVNIWMTLPPEPINVFVTKSMALTDIATLDLINCTYDRIFSRLSSTAMMFFCVTSWIPYIHWVDIASV